MGSTDGEPAATTSVCRRRNAEHELDIDRKDDINHATSKKNNAAAALDDNALTHHCDYFDLSSSGIIWPLDTYLVCRTWHWSLLTSLFFAGAIHFVQSYGTNPGVQPDPFWRIWKANLHRNKHGSSTMAFRKSGAFDAERLHEFIASNDLEKKGGITMWELWTGLKRQALPLDLFGQVSNFFEWFFAFLLVWPEDGVLREEDARAVCSGEMFRRKAEQARAQHPPTESSLFRKKVLSLVIVDLMVLPAIAAGMCYFVLRAADDVMGLWIYGRKTIAATQGAKTKRKAQNAFFDSKADLEGSHPSAAGIVGLVIIVGFAKLTWPS